MISSTEVSIESTKNFGTPTASKDGDDKASSTVAIITDTSKPFNKIGEVIS